MPVSVPLSLPWTSRLPMNWYLCLHSSGRSVRIRSTGIAANFRQRDHRNVVTCNNQLQPQPEQQPIPSRRMPDSVPLSLPWTSKLQMNWYLCLHSSGRYCLNATAPMHCRLLPTTGLPVRGFLQLSATDATGTTTYTFTPDAGQCAVEFTMDIEITDELVPVFAQLGPFCLNTATPDHCRLLPTTGSPVRGDLATISYRCHRNNNLYLHPGCWTVCRRVYHGH